MSLSPVASYEESSVTLRDPKLKKLEYYIGLATLILPLTGTMGALVLAIYTGFGPVEFSLMLGMYLLTNLGIEVFFHRGLTHKSFQARAWVQAFFVIFGSMAAQGSVLLWVATHRRHHVHTDTANDPHSPYARTENGQQETLKGLWGFWHSHVTWLMTDDITNCTLFAKDIEQDPVLAKINALYFPIVIAGLAIPAILGGFLTGSLLGALKGLLWGGFVRMFMIHHSTLSNGSFAHLFGTRPFKTGDRSTNNLLFAVPTFGAAWHNNHHAFPHCINSGLKWWQIDIAAVAIRLFAALGLVSDVKAVTPQMIEDKIQRDRLATGLH